MTCNEVFLEIKKDSHYYSQSGGGVTFSGGECLLYPEFVAEVAKKSKENKIHTAIESAFFVSWNNVEKVIPYIDLFFADLKIANREKHRQYTGQYNDIIIENIKKLSQCHNNIILRIPIIPSLNDSKKDMIEFAKIINTLGNGVKGMELLRYNNLAKSKYDFLNKKHVSFSDVSQTDEKMKEICSFLTNLCGQNCYFI